MFWAQLTKINKTLWQSLNLNAGFVIYQKNIIMPVQKFP
jgi:hypothetical protein